MDCFPTIPLLIPWKIIYLWSHGYLIVILTMKLVPLSLSILRLKLFNQTFNLLINKVIPNCVSFSPNFILIRGLRGFICNISHQIKEKVSHII